MSYKKPITHDKNYFPLNYNPKDFYRDKEVFIQMPIRVSYIYDIDTRRYLVSNWGRLYDKYLNKYSQNIMILSKNHYITRSLKNKYDESVVVSIHRIIAATYIGVMVFDNYQVNHIDGVMWHNEPYNLEWVTPRENTLHAAKNGLLVSPPAEDSAVAILTNDQYHYICKLTEEGYLPHEINKIMNLGRDVTAVIQEIRKGNNLKSISSQYDFSNIPMRNILTIEMANTILDCLNKGIDDEDYILKNVLNIDIDSLSYKKRYIMRNWVRGLKNGTRFNRLLNAKRSSTTICDEFSRVGYNRETGIFEARGT